MASKPDWRQWATDQTRAIAISVLALLAMASTARALDCDFVPGLDGSGNLSSAELTERIQTAYDKLVRDPARRDQRGAFLACLVTPSVAELDRVAGGEESSAATRARLTFLGQRVAWQTSDPGNLAALKDASRALKNSANPDIELIALTDRAILQHRGELADAQRPKTTYPEYLAAKSETIAAIRADGTYQGGPYELFVDEVDAITLEERFFLAAQEENGADNTALLRQALELYDSMLKKMADPTSAATERQRQFFANDMRFRAAIDAFLAKDPARARDYVKAIFASGDTWSPTGSLDHIYVRRFLRLPYEIRVIEDKSGGRIEYDESAELNRFYNPRQIALYLCGLTSNGALFEPPYHELEDALLRFENFDYRAYLVSSSSREKLEAIRDEYRDRIDAEVKESQTGKPTRKIDYGGHLTALAELAENVEFRTRAREGASICLGDAAAEIKDAAPVSLELKGNWEDGDNPDRTVFGIYFGGTLTFDEATAAASALRSLLNLRDEPYLARPTIDG